MVKPRVFVSSTYYDLKYLRSLVESFIEELANRLVHMFSFVGDTPLDPFVGTGTTMVAAAWSLFSSDIIYNELGGKKRKKKGRKKSTVRGTLCLRVLGQSLNRT